MPCFFSDNVYYNGVIAGTRIYLGRRSSYLFPFMLAIVKWNLGNIQPLARAFWQMVSMLSLPKGVGWGKAIPSLSAMQL